MRRLLAAAALLLLAPPTILALLLWRGSGRGGIEDAYALAFGPADLGPVDFSTLTRRATPNDALACAPAICPQATPDLVPPVYPVPLALLRAAVERAAAAEPHTTRVFAGPSQERYVARTPLMRFPDTVDVLLVPLGEERATLALYSRSQIGRSDLGANRARLERWLARIGASVGGAPPAQP